MESDASSTVTTGTGLEFPVSTRRTVERASVVWIGLMCLAIANGGLREALLIPRFGPAYGHVISTLLLAFAILAVAFITIRWIARDSNSAWRAGIIWAVLTLAFEFLAGHYVLGNAWDKILADYNILNGRIWSLIPLTTLVAPAWAWSRIISMEME